MMCRYVDRSMQTVRNTFNNHTCHLSLHPQAKSQESRSSLCFDGIPKLHVAWLSMLFSRTCLQWSTFFSVYLFSVLGRLFTSTNGSDIFSNMQDFAIYVWNIDIACPLTAERNHEPVTILTGPLKSPPLGASPRTARDH